MNRTCDPRIGIAITHTVRPQGASDPTWYDFRCSSTELHHPVPGTGFEPVTTRSLCDNPFTVGPNEAKGAMDVLGALPLSYPGISGSDQIRTNDNPLRIGPKGKVYDAGAFSS